MLLTRRTQEPTLYDTTKAMQYPFELSVRSTIFVWEMKESTSKRTTTGWPGACCDCWRAPGHNETPCLSSSAAVCCRPRYLHGIAGSGCWKRRRAWGFSKPWTRRTRMWPTTLSPRSKVDGFSGSWQRMFCLRRIAVFPYRDNTARRDLKTLPV